MAKLTAEQFQEKHARNLKAAIPDMEAGILRVTVSPTIKAAEAKVKMQTKLNEAINSGKWEAGLRRVDLPEWQKKIIEKGLPRVSQGIDSAAPKTIAFASELLPYQDNLKIANDKMASTTLEDNIAKATHWIRGMAKFQRTK